MDNLWSLDLIRVESINLQTHWVLVVMDQFSRKIIGYRVTKGPVSGHHFCYMFNQIFSNSSSNPKRLSHDNDPLFRYRQWVVNLDMFEIDPNRSIPFAPTSHPFAERLIGTVRREFTDHILFWNQNNLERKLAEYAKYFNEARVYSGIGGQKPINKYQSSQSQQLPAAPLHWKSHCCGLLKVPMTA